MLASNVSDYGAIRCDVVVVVGGDSRNIQIQIENYVLWQLYDKVD